MQIEFPVRIPEIIQDPTDIDGMVDTSEFMPDLRTRDFKGWEPGIESCFARCRQMTCGINDQKDHDLSRYCLLKQTPRVDTLTSPCYHFVADNGVFTKSYTLKDSSGPAPAPGSYDAALRAGVNPPKAVPTPKIYFATLSNFHDGLFVRDVYLRDFSNPEAEPGCIGTAILTIVCEKGVQALHGCKVGNVLIIFVNDEMMDLRDQADQPNIVVRAPATGPNERFIGRFLRSQYNVVFEKPDNFSAPMYGPDVVKVNEPDNSYAMAIDRLLCHKVYYASKFDFAPYESVSYGPGWGGAPDRDAIRWKFGDKYWEYHYDEQSGQFVRSTALDSDNVCPDGAIVSEIYVVNPSPFLDPSAVKEINIDVKMITSEGTPVTVKIDLIQTMVVYNDRGVKRFFRGFSLPESVQEQGRHVLFVVAPYESCN